MNYIRHKYPSVRYHTFTISIDTYELLTYLNLDSFLPHNPKSLESMASQLLGKLWTGRRYLSGYYDLGTDDKYQLGLGYCCVAVSVGGGRRLAVVRDIVRHRPYLLSKCPKLYLFQVQFLDSCAVPVAPGLVPVPLPVVTPSDAPLQWMSHLSVLSDVFSLQPLDDDPTKFYVLSLYKF